MSVRKGWPGEGSLGAAARTQPPRQQYSAIAAIGRNREPIPLSCVPDGRGRRDSLTPGRRDFEDVRQLFDPHTLQGLQKCGKGFDIGYIEGAADWQSAQRPVVYGKGICVIAIEFLSDLSQRPSLEDDFSFQPRHALAAMRRRRGIRQHSVDELHLLVRGDAQRALRAGIQDGYRNLALQDGDPGRVAHAINIEFGAYGRHFGGPGTDLKGSANVVCDSHPQLATV